jgi:hypothetical protein
MEHAPRPADDQQQRREAQETLDHLRDHPTYAGSALASAGRRAAEHFAGHDPADRTLEPPDAVELWGRRIGRALSLAGCVALAAYLYMTYLR